MFNSYIIRILTIFFFFLSVKILYNTEKVLFFLLPVFVLFIFCREFRVWNLFKKSLLVVCDVFENFKFIALDLNLSRAFAREVDLRFVFFVESARRGLRYVSEIHRRATDSFFICSDQSPLFCDQHASLSGPLAARLRRSLKFPYSIIRADFRWFLFFFFLLRFIRFRVAASAMLKFFTRRLQKKIISIIYYSTCYMRSEFPPRTKKERFICFLFISFVPNYVFVFLNFFCLFTFSVVYDLRVVAE